MLHLRSSVGAVEVIGYIWQPGVGPCAMQYELSDYDIRNIEQPITRETVEFWLSLHSGDFQEVTDFAAEIDGVSIPWCDEESEFTFMDCMYREEECG